MTKVDIPIASAGNNDNGIGNKCHCQNQCCLSSFGERGGGTNSRSGGDNATGGGKK